MKRFLIRFSLLFAAGTLIIISSCDKNDDDDNGGDDPPTSNFTAKVDGNSFSAVQYGAAIDENNTLIIGGLNNDESSIVIVLGNFNGEGSFNFGPGLESGAIYQPDDTDDTNVYITSGENGNGNAVVTGWNATDSIISGTFSFNAQHVTNSSTVTVTSGVFSSIQVEFEEESGGTDPTDNLFSVNIDGTLWEQSGTSVAGNSTGTELGITAINTVNSTFFFVTIPIDASLGTHAFDADYRITYQEGSSTYTPLPGGSIIIIQNNQVDKHVEATFSFDGINSTGDVKVFADGEWNVNY